MNLISDVRQGLERLDHSKKELEKFGLSMAAILAILAAAIFFLGSKPQNAVWLLGGILFFLCGKFMLAQILKPLRIFWIGFSLVLGYFMSRLLLGLVFYIIITPIRVIVQLIGKDILSTKLEYEKKSYWHARSNKEKSDLDYEKMY